MTKFTGGPLISEEVAQRLDSEIANRRLHRIQYWPVFLLDGDLAGCCGLRPRGTDLRTVELGFQFGRDAWGNGYATEAAKAVIGWARTQGFTAIIAGHHPENDASRRTLLRLGFAYTHDELYPPTQRREPCYLLQIAVDALA